ncbi:Dabb family protein [Acetobacter musti]|uniref:Dabb family protein n=1 Tax=Acetobacter musti TaxID=864732 RepID=A0ABX0JTW2_9PROT|nr:Dabb family protein [Acetobacter musti]NHN86684.1 Dabb family protein [Acetobacter musti]
MKRLPLSTVAAAILMIGVGPAGSHLVRAAAAESAPAGEAGPDAAAQAARKLLNDVGAARFTAAGFRPGTVRHMVMFQLRPDVTPAERQSVISAFRDLVRLSKRPDGTPLIQSLDTGVQDSGEGADLGLELGFLVTFRSQGDRNYYVGRPVVTDPAFFDPAHERYKQKIAPFLKQAVVFDFPAETTVPEH